MNYKFLLVVLGILPTCNLHSARIHISIHDAIGSGVKPNKPENQVTKLLTSQRVKRYIDRKKYSMSNRKQYEYVDSYAFEGTNFTEVKIGRPITCIDDYAFFRCNTIQDIKLPNTLQYIGKFAFSECKNLKCIEIPANLAPENIDITMFDCCKSLNKIIIKPVKRFDSTRLKCALRIIVKYSNLKHVKIIDEK